MMTPDDKFWFVWNEERDAPRHKHRTFLEAQNEAARLARSCPGKMFHVLEWRCAVVRTDLAWIRDGQIDNDGSVPF